MPSRLVRLLSEARWLALAALLLYLVLILLTYSKTDPGWSVASSVPRVGNWGGRVGAWMADLMLYIFGLSAWWWCVLVARSVWTGYRRLSNRFLVEQPVEPEHQQEPLIRAVGFVFMLTGSMGIEFTRMHRFTPKLPHSSGGVLGEMIGAGMQPTFGFTGSTLLLLLLFGLGFSLLFQVSWLAAVERIGGLIEDGLFWVRDFFAARADRRGHAAIARHRQAHAAEAGGIARLAGRLARPVVRRRADLRGRRRGGMALGQVAEDAWPDRPPRRPLPAGLGRRGGGRGCLAGVRRAGRFAHAADGEVRSRRRLQFRLRRPGVLAGRRL